MYIENRHGRKRHREMEDLGKEGRDSEEGDDIWRVYITKWDETYVRNT